MNVLSKRATDWVIVGPGRQETLVLYCPDGCAAEAELPVGLDMNGLEWRSASIDGVNVDPPPFGPWTLKWKQEARLVAANTSKARVQAFVTWHHYRQEDIDRFFGALQTTCVVPVADLRDLLNALRPDPRDLADYEAKADSIGKFRARWPGEDWTQELFNTRGDYAEWLAMERQVELWRLAAPLEECLPKEATPDAPR